MERFILEQSTHQSGWWVCTDTENNIVCRFEAHKFNDTQKFTMLDDMPEPDVMALARMMREMGDWLAVYYKNIIF
jgi:hypothetical protein